MKKSVKIIRKERARRKIWVYILAIITGMFFVACTNFSQEPDPQDKITMLLSVRTSTAKLPQSRAQTDSETNISAVRVLVFEYVGNEYLFDYEVQGVGITTTDQQTQFKALLTPSANPLRLIIMANAEAAFASYTPAAGTPEATVREQIKFPFTTAGLTGDLPMYGEISLPSGLTAGDNRLSATMLRAIARMDVVKDLEVGSPDFVMEEVHVFRNYDKIQVIPNTLAALTPPRVAAPSIPDDALFLSNPISKIVPGGAEAITQLYISESNAATTEAERLNGTATVIVGGRFGGAANPITYYRADFDPGIDGHPLGQVLRNYQYVFNIKEVTARGWSTPQEAANNLPTSIVVDVQTWEEFSAELYFGTNQFALSSRNISMRYVANRTKRLNVESTLPYRIQWLDAGGNPTGDTTSRVGTTISNNNFDVTIVRDGTDPERVTHLSFHTRNGNYGATVITDRLRVSVDNWSIDIMVTQDNTALYSNRHFSVMSAYDGDAFGTPFGHLGNTTGTTTVGNTATAMRQIIDVQFAPGGVIGIGGFTFDLATDGTGFFGATSAANLTTMRRIIRTQNVIYLTYQVSVSNEIAQILLDWLDGDPRRVLIVGADNASTNPNLRSMLTEDATSWSYTATGVVQSTFIRAGDSAGNDDFFNGPFGAVPENTTFTRADGTFGYTTTFSTATVTPLIVGDLNRNAMIFGVNKTRRIIYNGDANLLFMGPLSNNNGNVTTAPDRFMANVWAWIVEQLIYGND